MTQRDDRINLLTLLLDTCDRKLLALRARNDPDDNVLADDLEKMTLRTRAELAKLRAT
jgi:hypothetical protein